MHESLDSREMKRNEIEREGEAGREQDNRIFLVAMRLGDTPVPIPNTMVKT